MKRFFLIAVAGLISLNVHAQRKIASYNTEDLMKRVANKDTTYIVNFWATWCIPCVKELPEFDVLETHYKDRPVKVLLVSFDFKESYPDKLDAFIDKRKVTPEVVWFNESANANKFIPVIEDRWSGALPATIIWDHPKDKKHFFEDSITAGRIREILDGK